jgi:hypothetical protein
MKNNRIDFISKVVFFGAVWGILEATLGFALHLLPALIAGSLMFPLVMFILYRAYRATGSRKAILYVAIIAIMIKSTNFFLPWLFPAKTYNPMIAMFIQSLLVFMVVPMLSKQNLLQQISAITIVSISWRVLMIGYYFLTYLATGFQDFRIASVDPAVSFILYEGLISAGFTIGVMLLTNQIKGIEKLDRRRISPLISTIVLIIALVVTTLVKL